jgi:hypothetical protein
MDGREINRELYMPAGRRMTGLPSGAGGHGKVPPPWARQLDALFHAGRSLKTLMESLQDRPERDLPGSIARSLIPLFERTPWPQSELPEAAASEMDGISDAELSDRISRWKTSFYKMVLRDHISRKGSESPYPFHQSMIATGNPEYAEMVRQSELEAELKRMEPVMEQIRSRLSKGTKGMPKPSESEVRQRFFEYTMLRVNILESNHILRHYRQRKG